MIGLRSYRDLDLDAVVALWETVFPDSPGWNDPRADIERTLCVQKDLFLVATHDMEVVGTAMAGFDGHRGWVYYLAVSPDHRGQGIGRALMRETERRLVDLGCTKLNLQVRADNPQAVDFYRQLGYEIEPRISLGKRLGHARASGA